MDNGTDGEQRLGNFYSLVTDKLEGVKLTSVSDLLEHDPDRARFGDLCAQDVPAFAIKSTVAAGRIRESLRIRARIKCRLRLIGKAPNSSWREADKGRIV